MTDVLPTREIGRPLNRLDGHAKVTGTATYAYEHQVTDPLYLYAVQATIARGAVTSIDATLAEAIDGVVAVMTHQNAPRLASDDDPELWVLQSAEVSYRGQIIAAVIAETPEIARHAASLIQVEYAERPHEVELTADRDDLYRPGHVNPDSGDRHVPRRRGRGDGQSGREARRDVHDPDRAPQPDGTPHHDRGVGRGRCRAADAVRLKPGRLLRTAKGRADLRTGAGPGAGPFSVRRRRLRVQALHPRAPGGGRARGPAGPRPAGEVRSHPAADVLPGRPPYAHHLPDPARRRLRRSVDRDHPRRDRAHLEVQGVRRADDVRHPHDVRGTQSADDTPAGRAGRPRTDHHARARGSARDVRAGVGDGRDGPRVRPRPDRVPGTQRTRRRPRDRTAVLHQESRRLPARGGAPVRLAWSRPRAGAGHVA